MAKINATSQGVRVTGLKELNKALKALGPDVQKELKAANFEVGSMVAGDAQSIAQGLGGVAAKVAPTIKATKTQAGAAVSLGGAAYPFAAGAEFGGQGRPTTQQFKPHLGRTGYFVYPSIRQNADEIESTYVERLDDIMRKNGMR
jgi:hypothetical protein